MLECQRDQFNLPEEVSYLNCANIAPLMNRLSVLGKEAIDIRQRPYQIALEDWFKPIKDLKRNFATLINCEESERIALIPSVSYGIATVAKNIHFKVGDEIVVAAEQYPSNYYSWSNIAQQFEVKLTAVEPPIQVENRGRLWNEAILNSITDRTKVVALGNVHWTDGTLFRLEEISKKAKQHNALLIIDGSQSIGALPFDIQKINPDAVFCVGYKWLLGPFSLGLSYFGKYFDKGSPLEENWINRMDSDDFQNLVRYKDEYRPYAGRYNVGENSNFHLTPILNEAIAQLIEWKVDDIQAYCQQLIEDPISELKELGCIIDEDEFRASHLFGIRFEKPIDLKMLQELFIKNQVYISLRGSAVRVSVNVYNDENDMDKLVHCIKKVLPTA